MTTSVPVNGDRLHRRLLELGLSDRDFCRRTGLGQGVLRGMMQQNWINGSTPVADLARCMREAGLTAAELLDQEPEETADDTVTEDAQTLAKVLISQKRMHLHERLAMSLGWTMDRLHAAKRVLDGQLAPIGLRLHQNTMGMTIRPADTTANQAITNLETYRDAEDGIHQGMARVLYAAYKGTLSAQETKNDHRVHLAALRHRDAIAFGEVGQTRYALSEATAFALDVP